MRDPITIITTVRDGDGFLDRYFHNLADVLGPDDFAVIVDDGSAKPVSLPARWQDDKRLKLLHPGPVGRGNALNLAIKSSPTDLIAIQDIDDLSLSGRLDQEVAILSADHDRLVFTRALSDPWRPHVNTMHTIDPARLYLGNPLHHSSLAMHRSVWHRVGGYDSGLPCCIDLDFYLRACCRERAKICRLNSKLIDRTLDPALRHFARIPNALYHQTRALVLDRYRTDVRSSIWKALAGIRNCPLLSGKGTK
ncbi:glycosyltransferase family 2 protein [Thalassospira tepidiphila]|uniref:glycosyltransferase family 2 protein n=1 Tax=Thalassospira tepidiphila TaxID=393657 RepID=UPI001BCF7B43|nr:glycosyltransferase family 2 protein [Thalassospira tepidiphila]